MTEPFVIRLQDPAATNPALTGGKGSSLAKLHRAGFRVPDGFVVTARSFKEFSTGGRELPQQVTAEIQAHLEHYGDQAFAVRSSSTAEDSADAAFAGQHETYLNIRGTEQILLRVKDSFSRSGTNERWPIASSAEWTKLPRAWRWWCSG